MINTKILQIMWITAKLKFGILKSSKKSTLWIFQNLLHNFFFKHVKISENLEKKERLQKKACERYQNLSKDQKKKEKKEKREKKEAKSPRRWKTKACWVKKKILQYEKKQFIIIIKRYFNL